MKIFFLFFLLFTSSNLIAATLMDVTGKVVRVWVHSSSYNPYTESSPVVFMAEVDGIPKACNNGSQRFAIGGDHPAYNTVVSMTLLAYATGKDVVLNYLDTCTVRSNSWDFAYLKLEP